MKVFILFQRVYDMDDIDFESSYIEGVFSSEEKAKQFAEEHPIYGTYDIEEYEVK